MGKCKNDSIQTTVVEKKSQELEIVFLQQIVDKTLFLELLFGISLLYTDVDRSGLGIEEKAFEC